jgi:hypothetical protein
MSDYTEHKLPPARRERLDLRFRTFAMAGSLVLLVLVLLAVAIRIFFPTSLQDQASIQPVPAFPAPSLQPSPPEDMRAFLQEQMAWLNSTGWVDQKAGIVHIPIADAMKKVADQGIPDWPKAAPTEVQR